MRKTVVRRKAQPQMAQSCAACAALIGSGAADPWPLDTLVSDEGFLAGPWGLA